MYTSSGTVVHVTLHRTHSPAVSNRSSLPMSQNPRQLYGYGGGIAIKGETWQEKAGVHYAMPEESLATCWRWMIPTMTEQASKTATPEQPTAAAPVPPAIPVVQPPGRLHVWHALGWGISGAL